MVGRICCTGAALSAAIFALSGCDNPPRETTEESVEAAELATDGGGAAAGPAAPAPDGVTTQERSIERDRAIFEATIERALREGVDSLAIGDRVVAVGRWFVGAEYVPGTLEVVPERLVINLEQFDCVTYVESILAIARVLDDAEPSFDAFLRELRSIRYRDGVMAGYPSRLLYFSEWIENNERLGIVENVTRELGGIVLGEEIDFMSTNREQYRALESAEVLERIRAIERVLSADTLYYIKKDRIAQVAPQIRDGDIIAITSTIQGLDIAHTGFAIWIDDRLHFMNAPLVGESVEISELPLNERIRRISGQDGIMVARPQPAS
ncbi:MAG: N-acetylmuramoyl-L-alanine amidase-like domain-containing protein [Longimicrobiales bacterium]